jgi:cell division protease FtsH
VYGVVTTGAENDLQQVTRIAHEMVVRWGMSPKVGPLNFSDGETGMFQQRPYSEETAALIDGEIRRIAEECQVEAERLLAEHRAQLDTLTQSLLHHDSLDEAQILEVTGIKAQGPPSSSAELRSAAATRTANPK